MKSAKNKITVIILAIITLATIVIGYGLAKYIGKSQGAGEATVAKWSFKVNDAEDGSKTFNLINTINPNSNVQEGKIAPGTNGYFDLKLDGTGSEVGINYIINVKVENKPENMKFYMDEKYTVELPVEENEIVINDNIPLSEVNKEKTVRIYWNWEYKTGNTEEEIYENNLKDTKDMGKTVTVETKVTGIQSKPEAKTVGYKAYYYVENANGNNYTLYTTKQNEKTTDTELTLSSIAIDIPNAIYEYGTETYGGEHVANVKIAEDGTTNVYMYYKRARYTLTTIAGENVDQVTSKGISTGTSKDNEKFEQSKKRMETRYKYGESITITANPKEEEDGYTYNFSKWETETQKSLGEKYDKTKQETEIQMPDEDVTIEATVGKTANTYKVIYNENTGTGKMESQEYEYEKEQALRPNTYTKVGYTFEKWNTKEDGTGDEYEDGQIVKNLVKAKNGEITLYAMWKANEYEIEYKSNGGTGTMENQKIKYDEEQKIKKSEYKRAGYTFVGWNKAEDGTDTSYEEEEQVLNLVTEQGGKVVLYAIWSAKTYTVEYDANGGEGQKSTQVFTYDAEKSLKANTYTKIGNTLLQ